MAEYRVAHSRVNVPGDGLATFLGRLSQSGLSLIDATSNSARGGGEICEWASDASCQNEPKSGQGHISSCSSQDQSVAMVYDDHATYVFV